MKFTEVVAGQLYGFREVPRKRADLQQVRALESIRSQWKVEWVEPNAGLQDYVKAVNLVVPWNERRQFLQDEESSVRLGEICKQEWPGREHPLSDAVDIILDSTGEEAWIGNRGELLASPDVLERVSRRAGMTLEIQPPNFVDRKGEAHLSFGTGVALAQAFAACEPQTVLLSVDAEQRE